MKTTSPQQIIENLILGAGWFLVIGLALRLAVEWRAIAQVFLEIF